jgi:hypothetical protein
MFLIFFYDIKISMKKLLNKNQKFIENFFIKKGLKLLVDLSSNLFNFDLNLTIYPRILIDSFL